MRCQEVDLKFFLSRKIREPQPLATHIRSLQEGGATVATLNGSFDLLHAGHLYIIYEAAKVADFLVVALNTDHSIQQYKGPSRPIIPLQERLEMMAAITFVDFVTWFDEETPCQLLTLLKPNIHVNGAEYGENCVEAQTVAHINATLHLIPRIPGLSTSDILAKIEVCDALSH